MSSRYERANATSRVIRPGDPQPEARDWEGSTPEARMNAVWELTLQCLAWRGPGEPRLQRSVVRIQRSRRWVSCRRRSGSCGPRSRQGDRRPRCLGPARGRQCKASHGSIGWDSAKASSIRRWTRC